MPHPEHAVEPLTGPTTDGLGFFTSVLRSWRGRRRDRRHRRPRRGDPRRRAALVRPRPQGRRVRSGSARSSAAGRPTSELAMYSVMWSEHCSYKSQQGAPAPVRREDPGVHRGHAARRHRRERRRRRHRPGLGGHLQGRVAQPPVVRRAVPGRGDRRRRHRPRHPVDGRPPGRGDGPAALRRRSTPPTPAGCCPAWSPASAATATASACRTSAARSSSTRPTSATRWSTRCASASCAHEDCNLANATGVGNQVVLLRRAHRRRRHRRRLGARVGDLRRRRPGQAAQRAGRRPVHGEAAHRVLAWSSSTADLVDRHPGPRRRRACPARPPSWPAPATAACACELDRVPLRDASLSPRGDPDERVAGADVRGRRRPTSSTRSWRSARSGTSRPP